MAKVSGRNWKRRFLTLNAFNLCYFNEEPNFIKSNAKNINDTNPKGEMQISVKSTICADGYDEKYGFKFKFSNVNESIVIAASTEVERDSWVDSISFAINDCKSFLKGYITVNTSSDDRSSLSLSKSVSDLFSSGKSKKYFILSHNLLSCHPNEMKTSKIESLININKETMVDLMDDVTHAICLIDHDYTLSKINLLFEASEYDTWKKMLQRKIYYNSSSHDTVQYSNTQRHIPSKSFEHQIGKFQDESNEDYNFSKINEVAHLPTLLAEKDLLYKLLQESYNKQSDELSKLQTENKILSQQNEDLNYKLKDLEDSLDLFNNEIFEKDSICEEQKNIINDFVTKLQANEQEIDNLKSEMFKSDAQHQRALKDQKIRSNSANFKVVELESKLKEIEEGGGIASVPSETPPSRRNSSIFGNDNSASDIKKYINTISRKDDEISSLSNDVMAKEDQVFRLQSHITLLNEELDESRNETKRLTLLLNNNQPNDKDNARHVHYSPYPSPIRTDYRSDLFKESESSNSVYEENKVDNNNSIISIKTVTLESPKNSEAPVLTPPSTELLRRSRVSKIRISQGTSLRSLVPSSNDPKEIAFHTNEVTEQVSPKESPSDKKRDEYMPLKRSLSRVALLDSSLKNDRDKSLPLLLDLTAVSKLQFGDDLMNTLQTEAATFATLESRDEFDDSRLSLSDLNIDHKKAERKFSYSESKEPARNESKPSITHAIKRTHSIRNDSVEVYGLDEKFMRSIVSIADKDKSYSRNYRTSEPSAVNIVTKYHYFPLELTQSDYIKRIFYIAGNGIRSCILRTFQVVQLTFLPQNLNQFSPQTPPKSPFKNSSNSFFGSTKLYTDASADSSVFSDSKIQNQVLNKLISKTDYYDTKSLLDLLLLNSINSSPANSIFKKSIHQEISKVLGIKNIENILNSARYLLNHYEKSLNSFEVDDSGKLSSISDVFEATRVLISNLSDNDLREPNIKSVIDKRMNNIEDVYHESSFSEGKIALMELTKLKEQMDFHLTYKEMRMSSNEWSWDVDRKIDNLMETESSNRNINIRQESCDNESLDRSYGRLMNNDDDFVIEKSDLDMKSLVLELEGVAAKMIWMISSKVAPIIQLLLRLSSIKEFFEDMSRHSRDVVTTIDQKYINSFVSAIDSQLELDISSEISQMGADVYNSLERHLDSKKYREAIKLLEESYLNESSINLLPTSPDNPKLPKMSDSLVFIAKNGKSLIYQLKFLIRRSYILTNEFKTMKLQQDSVINDNGLSIIHIEPLVKQNQTILNSIDELFIRPPELVSLNINEIKALLLQISSFESISDLIFNAKLSMKNNEHISVASLLIKSRSPLLLESIYSTWPKLRVKSAFVTKKRKIAENDLVFAADVNFIDFTVNMFSAKSLRDVGFTVIHLLESKCFDMKDILLAGYKPQELRRLRDSTSLSVSDLRSAGYKVVQCVTLGFDAITIQAGGYSDYELYESNSFSSKLLRKIGCDIQKLILISLFESLEGKYWRNNSNWCSSKAISEWYGVYLDSQGLVIKIDLRSNYLNG